MKDELVSRELAALLKLKGFDWECNKRFTVPDNMDLDMFEMRESHVCSNWNALPLCVSVPTQSLAQRWFRENHNMSVEVWFSSSDDRWICDVWQMRPPCNFTGKVVFFKTYEEALQHGLMKAATEI